MANPYLSSWEYIPDGEPRVFGNRVYIYGSHDFAGSERFCDHKLKVWSADVNNLNNWICHGDAFHTQADRDHESDITWTERELYAPDVVEKDGKYYLYAFIVESKGCVAVSDRPEGPFKIVSQYSVPENSEKDLKEGIFTDPGVLVDDDGRVYIYCGYLNSFMAEINGENMYEILPDTYKQGIIPAEKPFEFFEACSPRKVGDTYYLIYSPKAGSRLVYATSKSPVGPFEYSGIIVDNGVDFPGGNNHGSICQINGQWYIFYHRMTNNCVFSRRGCVEGIEILPDGTIPQVEMTSLGFEESLLPYNFVPADLACVLKGECFITERNIFERPVINIKAGSIIGFKYFDFGQDYSSRTMEFSAKIRGCGSKGKMKILIDDYSNGEEIGSCDIGADDRIINAVVKCITGRHSVYLVFEESYNGWDWARDNFKDRPICELDGFVFHK
ncbi:family 43 glycosylhydrolase [Clostridium sp.]|uniref:family 43 glycosylhydrolase n=1 Tax=Clostridium sp. TaxID=1506 RepID=UPI002842CF1C|nr:family 43 glycosylhydrolase [Clostridium sp.]MDR3593732.1 family 43 glycosylhydrolase [Clostridium sp.]